MKMGVEVIALAPGLLFAYLGKQRFDAQQSGDGVSRTCLEGQRRLLRRRGYHRPLPAQLVLVARRRGGQSGRQPSNIGNLGGRRHVAAHRIGRAGMPALAGRLGATPQLTPPQTGGGEHISNAGAPAQNSSEKLSSKVLDSVQFGAELELAEVRRRMDRLWRLVESTEMTVEDILPRIRHHQEN